MDLPDELKISDRIATQHRGKVYGELFELLEVLSEVNAIDVVENVQQCNSRTGIADCLQND